MNKQGTEITTDFSALQLKLASPDKIREWSYGEVTKAETINYRTQRAERGGLFDERIFGPEKDYECYCGKYRRIRYKDIVCEKCGVEVTRSIVRRERMGHIELATPVSHIWFLRGIPSKIAALMNLSVADVEKVIYFAGYIVTGVNNAERDKVVKDLDREYKSKSKSAPTEEAKDNLRRQLQEVRQDLDLIKEGQVLDETTYHRLSLRYGHIFEAGIGAEAIYNLCKSTDLDKLLKSLKEQLETSGSIERARLQKRYNLVKQLKRAGLRPEWMFLTVVPIIPPALRPMVALDGGRHATSDVNDLYRRVINRNNRLKKLLEINAPEVILRNEKRILQEAVDALIDNTIRHTTSSGGAIGQIQRRPLKSLSTNLKGKQGRFRQNLLGKRVDYSGRSVIVVGPELKLNQCGLPKHMALELFRPFVISKLLERELAFSIRGANRLIDDGIAEVWAILEEVIADKYVLLNRAPTLHRLGIQAFKPVLIEGNAIQIHPLVCTAFNADFDGDQMAVHLPLAESAQQEAHYLMSSVSNLLRPGNGDPIVNPRQDIVLGCYWMTKAVAGVTGEGKIFESPRSAIRDYDFRAVSLRAKIKVVAPEDEAKYQEFAGQVFETTVGRLLFNTALPNDYPYINRELTGKDVSRLVENILSRYGNQRTPEILDKIKSFGFKYATRSGISWGIDDVRVPEGKGAVVEAAKTQAQDIESKYEDGLLSEEERYRMIVEVWQDAKNKVDALLPGSLDPEGSVAYMIFSGARGSISQVGQMSGMKGMILNPAGRVIDFPVIPSYKEGLSPLEYFITTHGARKGLADTALQTSKSGYLTRRLVDVSQDIVIREEDCGDKNGRLVYMQSFSDFQRSLAREVEGRVLAKDIKDQSGKVLYKRGTLISRPDAQRIDKLAPNEVYVRSPLTCKLLRGTCQQCYGLDLGRGHLVKIGEAVGIVAAQAIGEPGTQLTMRTFHGGGIVSEAGDITMGLPRVEEIFEKRTPKSSAVLSEAEGEVVEVESRGRDKAISVLPDAPRRARAKSEALEYLVVYPRSVVVKKGDRVLKGQPLTDGSIDLDDLFKQAGREATENYILDEIRKIYELQGASIASKHVEIIVRQMFARKKVLDPGSSSMSVGQLTDMQTLLEGQGVVFEDTVMGITDVALSTNSWLSAASFQNTTRILIDAATRSATDNLRGLKENVIIGRLIPAGTGLNSRFLESGH